jgi:hypothetical protein
MRSSNSVVVALWAVLACSLAPATAKTAPPSAPGAAPAAAATPAPAAPAPIDASTPTPTEAPVRTDAPRDPEPANAKKGTMTRYDEAVKQLAGPTTWCAGARQLVALEDKRALVPLVVAYDKAVEADKLCLADAMEALGGESEARKLIASKDASERAVAIRLMVLFSSDDQLDLLNKVAHSDPKPALRAAARDALRQQRQTKKWEEVIAGYLASPDDGTRGWAIELLIKHNGKSSWQRVQDHLPNEKNPDLRAKIEKALASRPR